MIEFAKQRRTKLHDPTTTTTTTTNTNTGAGTEAGTETPSEQNRWLILGVICVATYAVLVDTSIVNVALPTLVRELDATTTELKWIVDAYNLSFAALVLVGGSLGDRFGRKTTLMSGLVIFALGNLVATTMRSPQGLMAMRAVMGVGAALVFPATLSIITNVFTDRSERAKAIGLWGAMTGLGVASAPIIGGLVIEQGSWRWIFAVVVPVAIVAFVLTALKVPQSRDVETPPLDVAGLVLSIVALAALVTAIIQAPEWGWGSASTLGLGGFALMTAGIFAWGEARQANPMLDVTLFRNLRFTAASGAVTFAFFALFGFIFLITQYFQFVRGYSPFESGLRVIPVAVSIALSSIFGPRLAVRFGTNRLVAGGLIFMSIGFGWIAISTANMSYLIIIGQMIFLGFGLGFTSAPATEAIMGVVPANKAGQGSAVNDATREVGGTLGVAVIGSVFASVYSGALDNNPAWNRVPTALLAKAEDGIGLAFGVVQGVGNNVSLAESQALTAGAIDAFMSGLHSGCAVAAAVTLVGAFLAATFLPAQPSTSG
jgi:EmrB/QacA subfamily drug resistance transporter